MSRAEKYEAASLLERVAIGEEGERREIQRAHLIAADETGRQIAYAALMTAAQDFDRVARAIELLGLEPWNA